MGALHELRIFFIGEKPSSKAERNLLIKLDTFILSFICLSQFINYLDRQNLTNAYVSGMKEEIGFEGVDFNVALTIFKAGYIIGGVPQSLIVGSHRVPLSFWFPFCAVCWSLLTLGNAFCHHVWQVQVVRFFMAMFEAVSFAGAHYILGSWYKPSELGKRACLLTASQNAGGLFAGIMQGAIFETMDGKAGLSGWRWLMVINALMSIPVVTLGFLTFPGQPAETNRWYLSQEEKELAISRLPPHKPTKLDWGVFKKVFGDWRFWAFTLQFCFNTNMEWAGLYSPMSLWMKWTGRYTTPQINYYPLGTTAITIASTCLFALWSDYTKSRWWVNIVMAFCAGIPCIMLLVPSLPTAGKFFAWYIAGMGFIGQAVNFSWANEACRNDDQLRSITLYAMMYGSNITIAWFNIALFPVTDVPNFTKGYSASLATCILSPPIAVWVNWRCKRRERELAEQALYADGEIASISAEKTSSADGLPENTPEITDSETKKEPSTVSKSV